MGFFYRRRELSKKIFGYIHILNNYDIFQELVFWMSDHFAVLFIFICFFMINKHVVIIVYIISVICGFSLYNIFLHTYSFDYDCLMLRLIYIHSQIHFIYPNMLLQFFWIYHLYFLILPHHNNILSFNMIWKKLQNIPHNFL